MKPKKALIVSIAFMVVLVMLSGCRRFRTAESSVPTSGISMTSQLQQSTDSAASAAGESEIEPVDQEEIDDTLDQILSELADLDSLYTQMDDVTESDLND